MSAHPAPVVPARLERMAEVSELGALETLLVRRDGPVLVVVMHRPQVLNAYDAVMGSELRRVWRFLGQAADLTAAVLTGSGPRSFSTGLDVDDTMASGVASPSLDESGRVNLTSKDAGVFVPVVAAVNGFCCAGGWHFVNDADVVVCSQDATFFDTHVDVGLANPVEAVGLLSRLPLTEVLRMVASGRAYRMDASRAHQLGLVTEVTPADALLDRALEIAHTIARHPGRLVQTSLATVWSAVLDQRAAAERLGLALLQVAGTDERRLTAFRAGEAGR